MDRFLQIRRLKKISILFVVICLLHITLFSRGFLSSQLNHEHTQHDYVCFLCVTIRLVENLLRQINVAVKVILILPILLIGIREIIFDVKSHGEKTLVELKVRMDN